MFFLGITIRRPGHLLKSSSRFRPFFNFLRSIHQAPGGAKGLSPVRNLDTQLLLNSERIKGFLEKNPGVLLGANPLPARASARADEVESLFRANRAAVQDHYGLRPKFVKGEAPLDKALSRDFVMDDLILINYLDAHKNLLRNRNYLIDASRKSVDPLSDKYLMEFIDPTVPARMWPAEMGKVRRFSRFLHGGNSGNYMEIIPHGYDGLPPALQKSVFRAHSPLIPEQWASPIPALKKVQVHELSESLPKLIDTEPHPNYAALEMLFNLKNKYARKNLVQKLFS
jgi:hypothetical protein